MSSKPRANAKRIVFFSKHPFFTNIQRSHATRCRYCSPTDSRFAQISIYFSTNAIAVMCKTFAPCFNGIYSRSKNKRRVELKKKQRLNPCFNGTYSRSTYIRGKVCGIDVELSLAPNDFGFIASAEADNITAINELYKRIWDLRKSGIYPMIYNYGHLYVELYVKGE